MTFLERIAHAVADKDLITIDNMLSALQVVHDSSDINQTVSLTLLLNLNKVKSVPPTRLIDLALQDIAVFKRLLMFVKKNQALKFYRDLNDIKSNALDLCIREKSLEAVKFLTEDIGLDLVGFLAGESPLMRANTQMDIFKYLFERSILAYQAADKDYLTELVKPVAEDIFIRIKQQEDLALEQQNLNFLATLRQEYAYLEYFMILSEVFSYFDLDYFYDKVKQLYEDREIGASLMNTFFVEIFLQDEEQLQKFLTEKQLNFFNAMFQSFYYCSFQEIQADSSKLNFILSHYLQLLSVHKKFYGETKEFLVGMNFLKMTELVPAILKLENLKLQTKVEESVQEKFPKIMSESDKEVENNQQIRQKLPADVLVEVVKIYIEEKNLNLMLHFYNKLFKTRDAEAIENTWNYIILNVPEMRNDKFILDWSSQLNGRGVSDWMSDLEGLERRKMIESSLVLFSFGDVYQLLKLFSFIKTEAGSEIAVKVADIFIEKYHIFPMNTLKLGVLHKNISCEKLIEVSSKYRKKAENKNLALVDCIQNLVEITVENNQKKIAPKNYLLRQMAIIYDDKYYHVVQSLDDRYLIRDLANMMQSLEDWLTKAEPHYNALSDSVDTSEKKTAKTPFFSLSYKSKNNKLEMQNAIRFVYQLMGCVRRPQIEPSKLFFVTALGEKHYAITDLDDISMVIKDYLKTYSHRDDDLLTNLNRILSNYSKNSHVSHAKGYNNEH